MAHKPDTILKKLKEGEYAPIYVLYGSESYYTDQITDYIASHVLADSEKSFNQVILYGKDVGMADIVNNARKFPMMSDRQVVIVKEAQDIKDIAKKEGEDLLAGYFSNPLPSTILVLAFKNKNPDKRKAVFKNMDKQVVAVESTKMYDNKLPEWVNGYVNSKGHTIDLKACHMLVNSIGNDLVRLSNEIDKILVNFEEKIQIVPAIIQKYIGISKDFNAFELQRSIAIKDVLNANRIVNYFGDNPKQNPIIPLIALLFSFFSKLIIVHKSEDKSNKALGTALGINPYFVNEYIQASHNYPLGKVIQNIHYLREADLKTKGVGSGAIPEGEILKELIFKLMH